jgi:hypothetical protein
MQKLSDDSRWRVKPIVNNCFQPIDRSLRSQPAAEALCIREMQQQMSLKVSVNIATSLDGFIARNDCGLDWLGNERDGHEYMHIILLHHINA